MFRHTYVVVAVAVALFLHASAPFAAAAAEISADAQRVLDQVRDSYSQLKDLEVSGRFSADFDVAGKQEQHENAFRGVYRAPNHFRHEMDNDLITGSDSKLLYVYQPGPNVYETVAAPEEAIKLTHLPANLAEVLDQQNPSLALALAANPAEQLVARAQKVEAAFDQELDGRKATLLSITAEGYHRRVYLDPQTHLIWRDLTDARQHMEKQGAPDVKKAELAVAYDVVRTDAAAPDERFAWAPPEGAREAPKAQGLNPEEFQVSKLQGQPAPDFTLPTIDGTEVKLSELKGSVVLLDFWATWCPPCVISMPTLNKVYEEFAPKGLKGYAIDMPPDTVEKIQAFFTSKNLTIPVLLDHQNQAVNAYKIEAPPTTLVIGKDGIVKNVFIGFNPEKSEQELREAIESAMNE